MSEVSRRGFIGSAAAAASMLGVGAAAAGDFPFKNNVPDPLLAGKELPTFKFALEKSEGRGHRRQLRQGGDRRATADLQGHRRRVDAARAGRDARAALARHRRGMGLRHRGPLPHHRHRSAAALRETNDFEPGDIWYFPRGHGHSIQCLGDKPCHFILDLRQRLLLRVRHVQHHRLDGPRAQGAAGEELRPAGVELRRLSQR